MYKRKEHKALKNHMPNKKYKKYIVNFTIDEEQKLQYEEMRGMNLNISSMMREKLTEEYRKLSDGELSKHIFLKNSK